MKMVLISLLSFYYSSFAWGMNVDAKLLKELEQNPIKRVKAILVFKKLNEVEFATDRRDYFSIRKQIYKNHIVNISSLKKSGIVGSITPLWIINGASVEISKSDVSLLSNTQIVRGLYSNSRILIPNEKGDLVSKPSKNGNAFQKNLHLIGLPRILKKYPRLKGDGIQIGILDTGIHASHPDLTGNTIAYKDFVNDVEEPSDDVNHGTRVAGQIFGKNLSGFQIGVAPNIRAIVGKIISRDKGATLEKMLQAFQFIADPDGNPRTPDHAHVVNNSWSRGRPPLPEDEHENNVLCEAIRTWVKLGITPVFAAGNTSVPSPGTTRDPAACPEAIAVGSVSVDGQISPRSSRGPGVWKSSKFLKPDFVAPGVSVLTTTNQDGSYRLTSNGTSFAAPIVVGTIALLYQIYPNANPTQIYNLLRAGSIDLGPRGSDITFGHGLINIYKTIKSSNFRPGFFAGDSYITF